MRISEVLDAQRAGAPRAVATIPADAGVRELLTRLARHDVGALVVRAEQGGEIEGIVSERDVVRALQRDEGLLDGPVAAIMTATVHTCAPTDSVDDLMATMTERRVRHVPVLDADGGLVGIVSIGDVVKSRIGQLEFERDQLDSYVHQS
ncbi:CBS domain-containing protein [Nocardioides lentus]|uniref:CBS domain-containing protein n=1 Tax=Nocardioides lentus TaxID=338077 RepID=A0ABN2PSI7_9ACTN